VCSSDLRISLIGPGDVEFHYQNLLKLDKLRFEFELEGIAKVLAESGSEIVLLPDKGVSLSIARLYKKRKGKSIIGAIPNSDRSFGIKHLEPYIHLKINEKPFFDKFIDTNNWFKHDLIKGLLGNALLYLGDSPGTNGELNYAIYLYKILNGRKEGLEVAARYIHPEIIAGKKFTIFVYSPFLINKKLSKELEEYIRKFDINLVYINSSAELKQELKKLS
jgi:hypothetical protein